ncbi:MAG TPA: glycosyltransferase, partial [Chthonomonadaceae bacterium]|nr:glycosyltransferase [Chthonomonadaceae bacterium]
PYRGEGFGLPIAEAMACGKPVVVTDYGAALDFANAGNAYLIPSTLARASEKRVGDIETVDYPFWAEPDVDALTAMLRRIVETPEEARARGRQAALDIASRWTWAHAAQVAAERLEALAPSNLHRGQDSAHGDGGDVLGALERAIAAFQATAGQPESRARLDSARGEVLRAARRIRKQGGSGRSHGTAARRDETYRTLMAAVARADAALKTPPSDLGGASPAPTGASHSAHSTQHSALRLSVIMIVKNEERFLRDCLESVREAADEIVVVDTGSTDRSMEIAREGGAKVVQHAWTDDFAAARNVSLDHATGDWALWIDADEQLPKGEARLLRALIAQAPPDVGGYMVNIRNYMGRRDSPGICWHRACRLFRILPQVRFVGRIHEQNARALQEAGYACPVSKLTLDHYGYADDVMIERNKRERFLRMLERAVEDPDDPQRAFHLFNLGNAYSMRGEIDRAIASFQAAAEKPDPTDEYTVTLYAQWATALTVKGRAEEARAVCREADGLGLAHPGIDFAHGHAARCLKDFASAEALFRRAIERGKSPLFAHLGDAGTSTYKAYYGLALVAEAAGDSDEEVVRCCRQALAQREDFLDARFLLAHGLRRLGRFPESRRQYEAVILAAPRWRASGRCSASRATTTRRCRCCAARWSLGRRSKSGCGWATAVSGWGCRRRRATPIWSRGASRPAPRRCASTWAGCTRRWATTRRRGTVSRRQSRSIRSTPTP